MPQTLPLVGWITLVTAGCFGIPIHARGGKREIPAEIAALGAATVEVPAGEGVTLRGIWVAQQGPPVLLLYGSGMGIAGSREAIKMLHQGGYSVLCCDYRGTGFSGGRWGTSRTLDDDARALWEWLLREKGGPGGVVGISIGSVAGAGLASHPKPPAAIVLDRPVDPKNVIYRFVRSELGPVSSAISHLLVRAKCDVDMAAALAAAKAPTLVVLPEYDRLMPPEDGRRMTAAHSNAVEVVTMPGGHLSSHLVEPVKWRSAVLDHLDRHLRPGQPPTGGRRPPEPPAIVTAFRVEGRKVTVTLDRNAEGVTLLFLGTKGNGLALVDAPKREFALELTRRQWRKLGKRLFAVRVAPPGVARPIGSRWLTPPP